MPGPQTTAYESEADEVFYGGAAGGGKSDLLLGLAATRHTRSIVFRREFPQLREIVERARTLYGPHGSYNDQLHLWRMGGSKLIEFGAVQLEKDVEKYQGRAHDFIGFDELPQFSEKQYRFLMGWNRTTVPGQRSRVVAAGNPPTNPEGEWVLKRWGAWLDQQHPNPAEPGDLRWYAVLDDGEEVEVESGAPFEHNGESIQPRSRTFIPARLKDNPYLVATGYGGTLQGMPEPLRSQMLYGNFSAGHMDDPWQVIPTAWVIAAQNRWKAHLKPSGPQDSVGVDVARGGKDKTVIARRWGSWYDQLERHAGKETPSGQDSAALVTMALLAGGVANIDIIGVGASTYDLCVQADLSVNAVNFAEAAPGMDSTGKLRFVNLRAYAYWKMREALDPERGEGIMLPPDNELKADLCAPKWMMRQRGIQIEDKDDITKRIGRSPDAGDAVVMAGLIMPGIQFMVLG